jgi:hypothetical protein
MERRARQALKWLLIFDNIDQYSTSEDQLKEAYHFSIIIPSANYGSITFTS